MSKIFHDRQHHCMIAEPARSTARLAAAGIFLAVLVVPAAAFGVDCRVQNRTLLPHFAPYDLWHQADHPDLYKRTAIGSLQRRQPVPTKLPPGQTVPQGLKIAFVGDVTLEKDTQTVYKMLRRERIDFLSLAGDLDYKNSPDKFVQLLDSYLPNVPTMVVIGNHDLAFWGYQTTGYGAVVTKRYQRLGMDKYCTGEVGIKSTCTFKGVTIVGSGVGTQGDGHEAYLSQALTAASGPVKFCMWHKNQQKLQVGNKKDEVGFGPYEACRRNGAAVITGHNHGYGRSYLLSDMIMPTVASNSKDQLNVRPGHSWIAVVGTGGRSLASAGPNAKAKHWAKSFTKDSRSAAFGAMICVFNADGKSPNRAECSLKSSSGKVLDNFVTTFSASAADIPAEAPATVPQKKEKSKLFSLPFLKGKARSSSLDKRSLHARSCRPVHLEVTAIDAPETQNQQGLLDLNGRAHTLSFNLAVPPHARIKNAFLQVYGSSDVRASQNHTLHINSGGVHVPWLLDEEKHEVWVSPDIRQVVESHQAQKIHAQWNGGARFSSRLGLTLRPANPNPQGAPANVHVAGVDQSRCFSPTLAVVMEICD